MELNNIQKKIVEVGVKNLQEYGYPEVNEENILTDFVYSQFFQRILEGNLDSGIDKEIKQILKYISENRKEFGKV